MTENDVKVLIDSFKSYRDMLVPIEQNIHSFLETYDSMRNDIDSLNKSFDKDVQKSLQSIYANLSTQAQKSQEMISKIDEFTVGFNKYATKLNTLLDLMNKVESKLVSLNDIESKAEKQLEKLDVIIEEKQKTYNVKDLEKALMVYDENVQKVSQFINEDVVKTIEKNTEDISLIKSGNQAIMSRLEQEKSSIDKLTETYKATNDVLRKIIEKDDVNEMYIYDILDKWAESRKVKTKIKD